MNLLLNSCNFDELKMNIMRLTLEQKKELICDYQRGMSWVGLCTKWKTNTNTIHEILKCNNIQKTRMQKQSWDIEKQELFKKMYLANCTYKEMYKALNCKGGTLTYWVHKLNLPMRGSGRNNTYPNKFIEHTPESDYWLGYLFADGHVGVYKREKGMNAYLITLSSEMKYVVDKFKEWYDGIPSVHSFSYTLKNGNVKTMYSATLYSKAIANWFKDELGIDNVKHHTLNPNIDINWNIIRGFFDGDGSSSKKSWQLKSCSKVWLERIRVFLEQNSIKSTLKKSYLDCWGLYVYDQENLKKIIPLMYKHKYYCHEYKYLNFEPLISNGEVNIG